MKKTQKAEVEYQRHQFNRSPTQKGHLWAKQVGLIHSKRFVLALYLHFWSSIKHYAFERQVSNKTMDVEHILLEPVGPMMAEVFFIVFLK